MSSVLRVVGAVAAAIGLVALLAGQIAGGIFYLVVGIGVWIGGHWLHVRAHGRYRSRLAELVVPRLLPAAWQPSERATPAGGSRRFARVVGRAGARERAAAAAELSAALGRGWRPEPLVPPIRLGPDEELIASLPVAVEQHQGADVPYTSGGMLILGNPFVTVATAAGSVAWSARQRRKAASRARPQWRRVDTGVVHFTTQRLALQVSLGWQDLWYADLRASTGHDHGLELWPAAAPPTFLVIEDAPRLYVLLRFLADGEIVPVTLAAGEREGAPS